MSDKNPKSIVEIFIDVVVDHVIKDSHQLIDILQECIGDENEKYSNIELPEEEDK